MVFVFDIITPLWAYWAGTSEFAIWIPRVQLPLGPESLGIYPQRYT